MCNVPSLRVDESNIVCMLFVIVNTSSLAEYIERIYPLCDMKAGNNIHLSQLSPGSNACQTLDVNQRVGALIDGNLSTIHVNLSRMGGEDFVTDEKGWGTGFVFGFQRARSAVLQNFQFGTGNGEVRYDPKTITIEGSIANDFYSITLGSSWRLVYTGSTGIDEQDDPGRNAYGQL